MSSASKLAPKMGKPSKAPGRASVSEEALHQRKKPRREEPESEEEDESQAGEGDEYDDDSDDDMGDSDDSGDEDDSGTEEDDTDEDDDDSDGSDDSDDASEINVTFEFMDPQPIDFKSMRRLLERFLPGAEDTYRVSEMVDSILGQAEVGTTVKVEGDLDVYAFATLMPLAKYSGELWFQQMSKYFVNKTQPDYVKSKFARLLGWLPPKAPSTGAGASGAGAGEGEAAGAGAGAGETQPLAAPEEGAGAGAGAGSSNTPSGPIPSSGLALLLNERVVNMPPELAGSILDNLHQDTEWARTKGPKEDRHFYQDLQHVIVVAPCWLERTGSSRPVEDTASYGEPAGAGAGSGPTSGRANTVHYYHWEDALFEEEATAEFEFPVAPRHETSAAAAAGSTAGAAAGAGAGAGSKGGRKRKAGQAGLDNEDGEDAQGEATSTNLRAPQLRRVFLVPYAALHRVSERAKAKVESSRAAEAAARSAAVAKLTQALEEGGAGAGGGAGGAKAQGQGRGGKGAGAGAGKGAQGKQAGRR